MIEVFAGHCLQLLTDKPDQQLKEVWRYFNVVDIDKFVFSRCVECNGGNYLALPGSVALTIADNLSATDANGDGHCDATSDATFDPNSDAYCDNSSSQDSSEECDTQRMDFTCDDSYFISRHVSFFSNTRHFPQNVS